MAGIIGGEGVPWEELEAEMRTMASGDADWRRARTAVYVFNAGPEVRAVGERAYTMFMAENGLAPRAFPSLARMEGDVVDAALALLGRPSGGGGTMTSGGSESIFMAMKACRERATAAGSGGDARRPFVALAPVTAHPAFDKAAIALGLEVRRVPVAGDMRADVAAMAAAVCERTIMLVGSAPCFPYGVIDPIEELGALAQARGLWMHVDACVGGFLAPFVAANGEALPPFDFRVGAVTSMSADLHKYGYVPKGASVVLYRDAELLARWQTFDLDVWPNGRMTTPTLAGTRPGGAIAAAWAVLRFLGEAGYREKARAVTMAREALAEGVSKRGFRVFGRPRLGLVAFGAADRDMHAIGDAMRERGWVTARVQQPDGLHLMLSPAHREVVDVYLDDLDACTREVTSGAGREKGGGEARYN